MDKKRYSILRNYANANHTQFRLLKVSELISAHLLNTESQIFIEFIKNVVSEDLKSQVEEVLDKSNFLKFQEEIKDLDANNYFLKEDSELIKGETSYEKWLELVKKFTETIKDIFKNTLRNSYVEIYQAAGDSIRRTGTVTPNPDDVPFNLGGLHVLPAMIIKLLNTIVGLIKFTAKKLILLLMLFVIPTKQSILKIDIQLFILFQLMHQMKIDVNIYKKNLNLQLIKLNRWIRRSLGS
ncbi:hypothetical protein [Acinetobacter baumannii]|uniref:hypothetical protein n=1 Tax=Acinetobacter baumannii TaxID=470 RepID=UPI000453114F|nr:hypothetical protein [Acinetobacter baumannii]EYS19377.1 putative deoxycytidylate deaminase domain protein [Acinetobacter baumannii 25569_3]